ncbi:terminase, ATPase subunit [Haemophilus influenzae 22.4-21]|uniref:Terminase, ATPase subunit n=1 Tax=Haemophilus influenzae 22.4-21 TaxID=375063 RepID=A4P0J7_HAEIF|nr:terminase, ATPase subunit [Haemophilus influenzae 22.4-21]
MCQFADDNSSAFKFSDLQLCQVDSLEEWHDYKPFYQRPFGNREVWLGYDPAFTGDRAALVIVAPPKVEGEIIAFYINKLFTVWITKHKQAALSSFVMITMSLAS